MRNLDLNNEIKYFIYARKSSESEDRQMNSIEDQIEVLTELAEREGLKVVEVLQESTSAKKPGRKVFNEMIERIHKGEAQGIIAWKLNRLARNPVDGGTISYSLQNSVIKKIITTERVYNPDDNVLMMAVELGMANQFIKDLSKDTRRGLIKKAERGWPPYLAPLGYKKHPEMKKGEKEVIIDEERFYGVKKIWDLILSGNYNVKQALNIATEEYGLRSRKGEKINPNSIYQILRNPFYYGKFEYPKGSGNWYKGKYEPMITKKEFDKVQTLISNHSKTKNEKTKKDEYPYKGNLKCGSCGVPLRGDKKRRITCDCKHRFSALKSDTCPKCGLKLSEMKNPKIEERYYYACKNKDCPEKTTPEKRIEENILELLEQLQEFPKEFLDVVVSYLDRVDREENKNLENNLGIIRTNIKKKETKLDNLIQMRLDGELDSESFKKQQLKIKEEIEELKNILENKAEAKSVEKAKYYMKFSELAKNEFENAPNFKKKEIFNAMCSNQLWIGGKLLISKDSSLSWLIELANGYKSQKEGVRTTKNPYFTTKKEHFDALDSEMLHR